MTVAELINFLQAMPSDFKITIDSEPMECSDVYINLYDKTVDLALSDK